MKKLSIALLLAIFTFLPSFLNPKVINALSCVEFQGYEAALKQSDVVFQGIVIDTEEDSNGGEIYTFQVSRTWTEGTSSKIKLYQSEAELMWSYDFVEGEEYIVFATLNEDLNPHLPLCGTYINLTTNTSELDQLISEIGEPQEVEPGTGIKDDFREEEETTSKVLIGFMFFLPIAVILGSLGYFLYKDRK
jgi:hypothetical protein